MSNLDAIRGLYFNLPFIIAKMGTLDASWGGVRILFYNGKVGNLDPNLGGNFELSFIMLGG